MSSTYRMSDNEESQCGFIPEGQPLGFIPEGQPLGLDFDESIDLVGFSSGEEKEEEEVDIEILLNYLKSPNVKEVRDGIDEMCRNALEKPLQDQIDMFNDVHNMLYHQKLHDLKPEIKWFMALIQTNERCLLIPDHKKMILDMLNKKL